MNAKLSTRKEANGTYSWKLSTADYRGVWERTEARTPWGARVQGAPFLKAEREAAEMLRHRDSANRPGARGYSMMED